MKQEQTSQDENQELAEKYAAMVKEHQERTGQSIKSSTQDAEETVMEDEEEPPVSGGQEIQSEPAQAEATEEDQTKPAEKTESPWEAIFKQVKEIPELAEIAQDQEHFQKYLSSHTEVEEMYERYEALQEEVKQLKTNGAFKDEKEQAAFEFVKSRPTINEGIQEYYRVMAMDIQNMSAKDVLREAYLRDNAELPKEKMNVLFEREFSRKYPFDDYNEENFEDKEELEILRISLEKDALKARKELTAVKEAMVMSEAGKESKQEIETVEVEKTKEFSDFKQLHKVLAETKKLLFPSPTEDKADNMTMELSQKQVQQIEDAMKNYIGSEKAKGSEITADMLKNTYNAAIRMVAADNMVSLAIKHGMTLGRKQLMLEIEGKSPKPKTGNASSVQKSPLEMAQEAAAKASVKIF